MTKTRIWAVGLAMVLCGAGAASAVEPSSRVVSLDISARPLGDALAEFGKQADISIVLMGADLKKGMNSRTLTGKYSTEDALAKLLEGTGLRYEYLDAKTIAIRGKKDGKASGVSPADQMRVADSTSSKSSKSESSAEDSEKEANQVIVRDSKDRPKPFSGANADIPRTINDAQPYYIFDAQTIERSGAANIEDFLKRRLTMNTVAQTNGSLATGVSSGGNTSSINLRGVGADKTLVLVNGRRRAGVNIGPDDFQPDLNGIPLAAIDRIEVLPSSASGIYGGSAIGGVVNVILKRDYTGGQMRMNYENTVSGDSPARRVSASYGVPLEDGRTHLGVDAAWSDSKSLLLRDRVWIFRKNLADIQSRNPTFIYSPSNPWLGRLPNIVTSEAPTLTLKAQYGGAAFSSNVTHVPADTKPGTSTAELAALLLANDGQWNLDFPLSTQTPTGLLRPFGQTPTTRSLGANMRRQMLPSLELTAEFLWSENRTDSIVNPTNILLSVPASAPTNPFTTNLLVRVPDASQVPTTSNSQSRSATLGALVQLPWGWTGAVDYTWSENCFEYHLYQMDDRAFSADLRGGQFNPFVDTLRYPLDIQKYLYGRLYEGASRLHDVALRGSGPLPALPWGQPHLTVGLERRIARTPERTLHTDYPIAVTDSLIQKFYARESTTDSGYLEMMVPLVTTDGLPGLNSLDLQLSGRSERYQVDTGTPFVATYYNRTPPSIVYGAPNLDGESPIFSRAGYASRNYTVGVKYQPIPDVTLRVSRATAFLPPRPDELIENPLPDDVPEFFRPLVIDPTKSPGDPGYEVMAQTLSGGNANLKPQNSRSLNAGLIWQPSLKRLEGLRLNLEYYRIEQFDAIGMLGAQEIVDQESAYPGRVTRDEEGVISQVNISLTNLYHRETEGWDLSLDYTRPTRAGRFGLHAVGSTILHLKNQYARMQPEYDAVHFPSEGGAAKYKSNITLNWESGPLMLAWSMQYFGSYKQNGAAGGPQATQRAASGLSPLTTYTLRQGSDIVASQAYHDLLIGYSFAQSSGSGIGGRGQLLNRLSMQFGVRNVLDKVPPMDAYFSGQYYMSPYGDMRLRSYWLNMRVDL